MDTEHTFAREEVLGSWWANAIGKFLSVAAAGLQLSQQDTTHVQVVASDGAGAAAVAIQGRWRWNTVTVSRAHPGGAAGTYDVFVTAEETSIVSVPAPFTDATDYTFALAIVAHGSAPTIVPGSVDVYRKVGEVQWDGAKIVGIVQTVPTPPAPSWLTPALNVNIIAPTASYAYPPAYRLEGDIVRLRGGVQLGGVNPQPVGYVLATLPVGVRPSMPVRMPVAYNNDQLVPLTISTIGTMTIATAITPGDHVSFEGLTFTL